MISFGEHIMLASPVSYEQRFHSRQIRQCRRDGQKEACRSLVFFCGEIDLQVTMYLRLTDAGVCLCDSLFLVMELYGDGYRAYLMDG